MPMPKLVHVGWMPWGTDEADSPWQGPTRRGLADTKEEAAGYYMRHHCDDLPKGIIIVKVYAEVPSND